MAMARRTSYKARKNTNVRLYSSSISVHTPLATDDRTNEPVEATIETYRNDRRWRPASVEMAAAIRRRNCDLEKTSTSANSSHNRRKEKSESKAAPRSSVGTKKAPVRAGRNRLAAASIGIANIREWSPAKKINKIALPGNSSYNPYRKSAAAGRNARRREDRSKSASRRSNPATSRSRKDIEPLEPSAKAPYTSSNLRSDRIEATAAKPSLPRSPRLEKRLVRTNKASLSAASASTNKEAPSSWIHRRRNLRNTPPVEKTKNSHSSRTYLSYRMKKRSPSTENSVRTRIERRRNTKRLASNKRTRRWTLRRTVLRSERGMNIVVRERRSTRSVSHKSPIRESYDNSIPIAWRDKVATSPGRDIRYWSELARAAGIVYPNRLASYSSSNNTRNVEAKWPIASDRSP